MGLHFGGKRPAPRDMVNQSRAFVPAETGKCQQRHMRQAGPARHEVRTESNDQQNWQPLDPLDDAIEELQARGIEPVGVLRRHQHRAVLRPWPSSWASSA